MSDERFSVGPYEVDIEPDDEPWNPIEDPGGSANVVIFHRDYDGLSNVSLSDFGIVKEYGDLFIASEHGPDWDNPLTTIEDIAGHLHKAYGAEVLRIKAYIHSGITISASPATYNNYPDQRWDVTHGFGIIFLTRDQIAGINCAARVSKKMRSKAVDLLQGIVSELDQYLSGDVWRFSITDEDGNIVDGYGSVFGYDEAIKEATDLARDYVAEDIIRPRTFVGEVRTGIPFVTTPTGRDRVFDQQRIRFDDGMGRTAAAVRIIRDHTTRPKWYATTDASTREGQRVLVSKGTREECEEAARQHFLAVYMGEEADCLGQIRNLAREEVGDDTLIA